MSLQHFAFKMEMSDAKPMTVQEALIMVGNQEHDAGFREGYRIGCQAMREKAAKAAEGSGDLIRMNHPMTTHEIAKRIRALESDE